MKSIGGYFELELRKGEEYHPYAIRLNTGRNAFEYILRAKKYKKVYLPYFTCDVMLEPIQKLSLQFEFYHIDEQLRPIFEFTTIQDDETFIYTNYFGLCSHWVKELAGICKNLIVDNSQAFFSKPLAGVDTFYSPRKFFGLPDGAFLYTDIKLETDFEQDYSANRFGHLLGRIDNNAEEFFALFKQNEKSLSEQPIKFMSKLTYKILEGIDYSFIAGTRRKNFNFLNETLGLTNRLNFAFADEFVPMVYPYWTDKEGLRDHLIQNKVYVAQYWPNVLEWCGSDYNLETDLTRNIIPIPMDQRNSEIDLRIILDLILKYE